MSTPHRIYFTRVMHRRLVPVEYRFSYRVFSLLLDLDEMPGSGLKFLSLMGMEASYDFRLAEPSDRLSVLIRQFQDGKLTLLASQRGEGYALSDRRPLTALLQIPLMTFKVMAAIDWQALKIWLRGASFFPKPPPPAQKVTQ